MKKRTTKSNTNSKAGKNKSLRNKSSKAGCKIHIMPMTNGGRDDLFDLQLLQWENIRYGGLNFPE